MSLCIFVEGGGDQRKTTSACRAGFETFFNKIVLPGHSPRIIVCGSRKSAYDDFCNELEKSLRSCDGSILLVDSEDFVTKATVWEYLKNRLPGDGWERPANATEDHVYLMVQSMESWFLADREALAKFYGQGFNVNALPGQPNIELISKEDVFKTLKAATEETKTKKEYHKTKHGFPLLTLLDPKKIGQASPHAMRLFRFLNPDFMSESEAKEAKLEAELKELIEGVIRQSGATSLADMGKVIGILKRQVLKCTDMQVVSTLVKQRLSG